MEYRDRAGVRILTHGYGGYARGCRCDTCRAAKANYIRERRDSARVLANLVGNGFSTDGRHYVDGITHGRFGYEERGCRCDVCLEARMQNIRDRQARRHPAGAST